MRSTNTIMLDDRNGEEYRSFLDYAIVVGDKYITNPHTNSKGETKVDGVTINVRTVGFPLFKDLAKDGLIQALVYNPKTDEGYKLDIDWDPKEPETLYIPAPIDMDEDEPLEFFLGYNFKMNIDLPMFYIKQESQGSSRSWDSANLIIQRGSLTSVGLVTTRY